MQIDKSAKIHSDDQCGLRDLRVCAGLLCLQHGKAGDLGCCDCQVPKSFELLGDDCEDGCLGECHIDYRPAGSLSWGKRKTYLHGKKKEIDQKSKLKSQTLNNKWTFFNILEIAFGYIFSGGHFWFIMFISQKISIHPIPYYILPKEIPSNFHYV